MVHLGCHRKHTTMLVLEECCVDNSYAPEWHYVRALKRVHADWFASTLSIHQPCLTLCELDTLLQSRSMARKAVPKLGPPSGQCPVNSTQELPLRGSTSLHRTEYALTKARQQAKRLVQRYLLGLKVVLQCLRLRSPTLLSCAYKLAVRFQRPRPRCP